MHQRILGYLYRHLFALMDNPLRSASARPLLSAVDVSTAVVPGSALVSSLGRAWNDIDVVRRRHATDALDVPPLSSHLLVLYHGAPAIGMVAEIGGQRYAQQLHTGALAIVPAGNANSWQWGAGAPLAHDSLHIYLNPRRLSIAVDGDDAGPELQSIFGAHDPQIVALGRLLLTELEQGGVGEQLYVDGLVNVLAVHLLRHYTTHAPLAFPQPHRTLAPIELRQVTDYIESTLSQPITLLELANIVHLSRYHFARIFKQTTGQSPHQYVIARRLARAHTLLLTGDLPIAAIASLVGFADQSHFSSHFRRRFGITPAQLRQRATIS